jgi:gamma-glutamyltranspeptidase/glutathione hydrolase
MAKTKGVVAAGHEETAKAGVAILEAGGNATDAAIAAALAGCVAEPCLISLASGGFMMVHSKGHDAPTLLDFFVTMPGKGLEKQPREIAELTPAPVDFGGTIQMFHAGPSSVAVPGFVAGLWEAHRRYGSLPMTELIKPAQELATKGVKVNAQQAYIFEILGGILKLTAESKELFFDGEKTLAEGATFKLPGFAETLELLAKEGAEAFYGGALADALVQTITDGGGLLTTEDLTDYEVVRRKPVSLNYRGRQLYSNPPPSSGGALIVHSLSLLSHFELGSMQWQGTEHIRHLAEAMAATNEVRAARFDTAIHDEDALERLLAAQVMADDQAKLSNRLGDSGSPDKPLGNTTHISVMDADGNAVSTTSSAGETAGVVVPGTGILLNNILGEEDLNPKGFHQHPVGRRVPSMMAPTILTAGGQPQMALGSAGSNRIRSAIIQAISAYVDFGLDIETAVNTARAHFEAGTLELEHGIKPDVAKGLSAAGYNVNLWKQQNLFFGGLQAVGKDPKTGELSGAGDPRRGGVALTT